MGHRLSNRACLDPIQLWCCCLIFYWKYVFGSASEFTHSLTSWLYVWSVPLMVRWMLTPHCPKAVEWGFKIFNLIFYEFHAKSFGRKLLFHKYLQVNRFSSFNWKPFGRPNPAAPITAKPASWNRYNSTVSELSSCYGSEGMDQSLYTRNYGTPESSL